MNWIAALLAAALLAPLSACGGPRSDLRMLCATASDVARSGELPPEYRRLEWAKTVAERVTTAEVARGLADIMAQYPPHAQYGQLRRLAKELGADDWHCNSVKRLLSGR